MTPIDEMRLQLSMLRIASFVDGYTGTMMATFGEVLLEVAKAKEGDTKAFEARVVEKLAAANKKLTDDIEAEIRQVVGRASGVAA